MGSFRLKEAPGMVGGHLKGTVPGLEMGRHSLGGEEWPTEAPCG